MISFMKIQKCSEKHKRLDELMHLNKCISNATRKGGKLKERLRPHIPPKNMIGLYHDIDVPNTKTCIAWHITWHAYHHLHSLKYNHDTKHKHHSQHTGQYHTQSKTSNQALHHPAISVRSIYNLTTSPTQVLSSSISLSTPPYLFPAPKTRLQIPNSTRTITLTTITNYSTSLPHISQRSWLR